MTWTASVAPYPVGYEVSRALLPDGPWVVAIDTMDTFFTDTGLAANTDHYYRVRAYQGEISDPAQASATTEGSAAGTVAIAGLALIGLGGLGYYLYQRRSGGDVA